MDAPLCVVARFYGLDLNPLPSMRSKSLRTVNPNLNSPIPLLRVV